MTIILTATDGAIAENPTGFRPPVTRGLRYICFHGRDADRSARNLWLAGPTGAGVVGDVEYDDHFMRCTGYTDYVQLPFYDGEDSTIMSVASSPATLAGFDRPMFVSNLSSVGEGGASLYVSAGTPSAPTILGTAGIGTGIASASLTGGAITTPRLLASTVTHGVGITVNDYTADVAGVTANAGVRNPSELKNLRIGSCYLASYVGIAEIYCTAIYEVALTETERLTMASYLRGYYSRRGITI